MRCGRAATSHHATRVRLPHQSTTDTGGESWWSFGSPAARPASSWFRRKSLAPPTPSQVISAQQTPSFGPDRPPISLAKDLAFISGAGRELVGRRNISRKFGWESRFGRIVAQNHDTRNHARAGRGHDSSARQAPGPSGNPFHHWNTSCPTRGCPSRPKAFNFTVTQRHIESFGAGRGGCRAVVAGQRWRTAGVVPGRSCGLGL